MSLSVISSQRLGGAVVRVDRVTGILFLELRAVDDLLARGPDAVLDESHDLTDRAALLKYEGLEGVPQRVGELAVGAELDDLVLVEGDVSADGPVHVVARDDVGVERDLETLVQNRSEVVEYAAQTR